MLLCQRPCIGFTTYLFPERDASECVTRVAPDILDVLGTAADVNDKIQK